MSRPSKGERGQLTVRPPMWLQERIKRDAGRADMTMDEFVVEMVGAAYEADLYPRGGKGEQLALTG